MKKIIKEDSKFLFLFIISILSIVVPSFVKEGPRSGMVFNVMFSIMVIVSTLSIAQTKRHRRNISLIGALTLLFTWILILDILPINHPTKLGVLPLFFFFIYTVYRLIITILKSKKVTPDVIFGAITGYIFLGFAGAFYFEIIQDIFPNSFDKSAIVNTMSLEYYSFVTMTSLGYGEIVPLSNAARSGAILLTIFGQFYIAVVVAILVSKYLVRINRN